MKFKKILIVCLTVVIFATLMCTSVFATSAQTTAATYGHYISPGDYYFDDNPAPGFGVNLFFPFKFFRLNGSSTYYGLYFYPDESSMLYNYNYPVSSGGNLLVFENGSWLQDEYRYITVLEGFYIYDAYIYQWWQSNVTRVSPGYDSNLFDGILSSFSFVGNWISGSATTLTTMFFVDGALTFLGVLAVSALAFAVAFLIIGLLQRFLKFRG